MNRLLILGILIISTAPLFAQAQQPNAAELAQKVVSIISGDKAKTQTYCQILDLSDEVDEADPQKDREKAEKLSQEIHELQKNLAPNSSRCSRPLSMWIQIPKTVRRSCRTSLSSIISADNGDVLIRGLTSAYSDDPAAWASTVAKWRINAARANVYFAGGLLAGFDIRVGNSGDRDCGNGRGYFVRTGRGCRRFVR